MVIPGCTVVARIAARRPSAGVSPTAYRNPGTKRRRSHLGLNRPPAGAPLWVTGYPVRKSAEFSDRPGWAPGPPRDRWPAARGRAAGRCSLTPRPGALALRRLSPGSAASAGGWNPTGLVERTASDRSPGDGATPRARRPHAVVFPPRAGSRQTCAGNSTRSTGSSVPQRSS